MEKLRIQNDEVYRIEVNDNGEYIEFDLLDIELPIKAMRLSDNLKKEKKIYNNRCSILQKEYGNNSKLLLYKQYDLDREFCLKFRKMFDEFLGEGACKKIFGDTNRIAMFDKLFEELSPHFDKLKINVEKVKNNLYEKYIKNSKEVI